VSIELVRRWFSKLPESERDLPVIIYNGIAYTPRMILAEVERGTPVGEYLQRKLEEGSYGTTPEEEYRLAMIRLEQILRKYPPDKPVIGVLSARPIVLTPAQLLREIREGTPLGRMFVEAELRHVKRLLRVR